MHGVRDAGKAQKKELNLGKGLKRVGSRMHSVFDVLQQLLQCFRKK
jgi:hypothetical protein